MKAFFKTWGIDILIGINAVLIIIVAVILPVFHVEATSLEVPISASVAREQAINKMEDLSFGQFIRFIFADAWVRILPEPNTNTNRVCGSSIILAGGNWGPAVFEVTGGPSQTYSIELPDEVNITHVEHMGSQDQRHKMKVNEFTSNLAGGLGTFDQTGRAEFFVGADLVDINILQKFGLYVGSFNVTAHFN
jgi:hypothetical protein